MSLLDISNFTHEQYLEHSLKIVQYIYEYKAVNTNIISVYEVLVLICIHQNLKHFISHEVYK